MQLQVWITENGIKNNWLAKKANIKPDRLSRLIHNKINITLKEAITIEDLTGGQVTPRDWLQQQSQPKE